MVKDRGIFGLDFVYLLKFIILKNIVLIIEMIGIQL